ncbi:MAG: carboxypeptidase [Pedobacter sp.]|nr:MAG: carboxypeptidase [Pedobacter sp.]
MKLIIVFLLSLSMQFTFAQKKDPDAALPAAQEIIKTADGVVKTKGSVTINGKSVSYTATTGYMPMKSEDGKVRANIFFVAYTKDNVSDLDKRPITYTFNGGPGSASIWLHMGVIGPKRIVMSEKGDALTAPYSYTENEFSWLDQTDLVFIDPVGTGFSRAAPGVDKAEFQGYTEDIQSVGEFIKVYTSKNKRWGSPKFLAGESYGTTRASGLSEYLQSAYKMYVNGIVLISAVLNFQTIQFVVGNDLPYPLYLPSYASTSWYYKKLSPEYQSKDLKTLTQEVEQFAITEYATALMKGDKLPKAQYDAVVSKLAKYTGLSETFIRQTNLRINLAQYNKELLRSDGKTVGRLDSRYKGIDKMGAGESPDYNAELTSWLHSFTPAVNMYIRNELNYKTDLKYNMFGSVYPWDNSGDKTGDNLRQAMAQNPYLHLLVQSGYYDGACDYFNAKYSMWQLDAAGKLQDRMTWEGYRSGHMMYLRKDDLKTANNHIRDFIKQALPKNGEAAKF